MRRQLEERKQSLLNGSAASWEAGEEEGKYPLGSAEILREICSSRLRAISCGHYPKLKKGMKEIEVRDYSLDPPASIIIPLEEALDPAANVDRYFRRYKKPNAGSKSFPGVSRKRRKRWIIWSRLFSNRGGGRRRRVGDGSCGAGRRKDSLLIPETEIRERKRGARFAGPAVSIFRGAGDLLRQEQHRK